MTMAEIKAKQASKPASKPIHSPASPYVRPAVDKAKEPHHGIIADRLVALLGPIKEYHAKRPTSKGKRGRKRKRHGAPRDADREATEKQKHAEAKDDWALSRPPILDHLLLGFNNTTRHLEALSTLSVPSHLRHTAASSATPTPKLRPVAAILLLRPLDDLIYSHLPTLCQTASLAYPDRPAVRLVVLDQSVEKRVTDVTGLGRVSVIALLEDNEEGRREELDQLVGYVTQHVEPIEVGWLKAAKEGRWMGTKIETR